MDIKNTNSQYFGARYISPAKVQRRLFYEPFYKNVNVSFVELTDDKKDLDALRIFGEYFSKSYYAQHISNKLKFYSNYKAYAITTQKTGFDNLEADKVIGICGGYLNDVKSKYPYYFITRLEAISKNHPERNFHMDERKLFGINYCIRAQYKQIGTELLKNILSDLLKRIENLSSIELHAVRNAIPFYKFLGWKQGVIPNKYSNTPFILQRNKFEDFLAGNYRA